MDRSQCPGPYLPHFVSVLMFPIEILMFKVGLFTVKTQCCQGVSFTNFQVFLLCVSLVLGTLVYVDGYIYVLDAI